MKKPSYFFLGILIWAILIQTVAPSVSALTIDDTLITKTSNITAPNFTLQTFKSCEDMRTKLADFMETYYEKQWRNNYYGPMLMEGSMIKPAVPQANSKSESVSSSPSASGNFSLTNTRTLWVDEPEKVKTDGQFIYTARSEDGAIYINRANDSLELVTKILLPQEYTSAELFLDGNRMVVIASKYFYSDSFRNAWIDRSNKAVVIVYDITNREKPVIERYSQIDGTVREARMIGGNLTLMTSTNFNFPYDRYIPKVRGTELELDINKLSADFSTANVLPKRINFIARKNTANIDTAVAIARDTRRLNEVDAASCAGISYVLPNAETLANYNFTPSFTAITRMNVRSANARATSSLMFGDVGKAYLAASGKLFLTSSLYSNSGWNCPVGPAISCMSRLMEPGTQTIVHQFDTNFVRSKYLRSTMIEGSLISDYAIDEAANGQLRTVTQKTGGVRESILSVLSPEFTKIGELRGLGTDENFQSARFIGDRLYLVTFKQIDPFYVVSLSDPKAPKVLGELKIPGYSTYLHPYDANRLIGVGYDTTISNWGGTVNGGVKVDLYDVTDVANPKQEGTLTLGDAGSYSDALSNPRMFVWNAARNTLYLPAQLNTAQDSKKDPYNYKDVFQWMVAISIKSGDSKGVVRELSRTTQLTWDDVALKATIDKECAQYKPVATTCRKLISGEEVCSDAQNIYIPNYCYADAGLGAYKAQNLWNQSVNFIDRVVYAGDRVYTLSRARIEALDMNLVGKGTVKLSPRTSPPPMSIMPLPPIGIMPITPMMSK